MKKVCPLVAGMFFLLLGFNVSAQSKIGADYFAGKWKVLISGTPYGDLKRVYVLDKKESSLNGIVQDSTGKEIAKCSKVEVQDNQVTLYYQAMGNDVSVTLVRKDDDHVSGTVLNMFEAMGERIK
jgi:hypothetical protein